MLTIKKGNLLDSDSKFIAHCANVHCTMGAGVALALANKWPEVAAADKTTEHTAICNKYGRYSRADLPDGRAVYNLYAQIGVGNDGTPLNRNARYDLLFDRPLSSLAGCSDYPRSRRGKKRHYGTPVAMCWSCWR